MIRGTKRASMSFSAAEVEALEKATFSLLMGVRLPSGFVMQFQDELSSLLRKAQRMQGSLQRSASSSSGDVHSPRETPGGGADV